MFTMRSACCVYVKRCFDGFALTCRPFTDTHKRFYSLLWNTRVQENKELDVPSHNESFEPSITSEGEPCSSNDKYCTEFVNRNPRNLEQIRYGYKPRGWYLEDRECTYWNKATIRKTSRSIIATLIHYSGKEIVSASSNEWAIKKHLYRLTDSSAVENVSRVFAQRCLESGFTHVFARFSANESETTKVQTFIRVLEEEGLSTTEPPQYIPPKPFSSVQIPKPPHYKA